jgi:Rrf2 family protein
MKMSTKGRYGLRVMLELALDAGSGPTLVENIAKKQELTENYIHVLVTGLKAAGLVRSVRGPKGGYELTRSPSGISALEVITALEGKTAPVDCVDNSGVCPRASKCAVRDIWNDVAAAIDGVLSHVTLEQLARNQGAKEKQPIDYQI